MAHAAAALLYSLRMRFRSLAIEGRASEVWQVLAPSKRRGRASAPSAASQSGESEGKQQRAGGLWNQLLGHHDALCAQFGLVEFREFVSDLPVHHPGEFDLHPDSEDAVFFLAPGIRKALPSNPTYLGAQVGLARPLPAGETAPDWLITPFPNEAFMQRLSDTLRQTHGVRLEQVTRPLDPEDGFPEDSVLHLLRLHYD